MAAIDVPASIEPAMPTPWYNTPMATTPVVSHTPLGVDIVPPFVPPAVSASTAGDDSVVEDMTEMVADARVEMPLADEWPLAEASAAIDELSRDLTEDGSDSPSRLFGEVSAVVPLPAWSDDDLLNIMPTRPVTPIASHPVQELFAEEPAAEPEAAEHEAAEHQAADASALAAAQALEVLAQRVRNGELQLPGYDPRMGDAAALVSALAALLGIRLG